MPYNTAMIIVHHLNNSRSQRVLWLLEELGVPYEVKRYQRDAKTMLAPPELLAVHPLGKSPVIVDGTVTVADVFYLINFLFVNGPSPIGPADANADGQVNVADIFYLINFLFANGPAPH